jgi:LemA protein
MTIVLLVGVVLAVVVAVAYLVGIYNGLVTVNQNVDKAWANIDVILKQRHDELPKLISVCEGYKNFERSTLEAVMKARSQYTAAATPDQKVTAANAVTGAMRGLLAVAESYPDLKTSQNFLQLQQRISGLEGQIADRREFFNDSVNVYNIRIREFPDMFFAGMMGFSSRAMYQVAEEDKQDVKVAFA